MGDLRSIVVTRTRSGIIEGRSDTGERVQLVPIAPPPGWLPSDGHLRHLAAEIERMGIADVVVPALVYTDDGWGLLCRVPGPRLGDLVGVPLSVAARFVADASARLLEAQPVLGAGGLGAGDLRITPRGTLALCGLGGAAYVRRQGGRLLRPPQAPDERPSDASDVFVLADTFVSVLLGQAPAAVPEASAHDAWATHRTEALKERLQAQQIRGPAVLDAMAELLESTPELAEHLGEAASVEGAAARAQGNDEDIDDLIALCRLGLDRDPERRPSLEVIQHRFALLARHREPEPEAWVAELSPAHFAADAPGSGRILEIIAPEPAARATDAAPASALPTVPPGPATPTTPFDRPPTPHPLPNTPHNAQPHGDRAPHEGPSPGHRSIVGVVVLAALGSALGLAVMGLAAGLW